MMLKLIAATMKSTMNLHDKGNEPMKQRGPHTEGVLSQGVTCVLAVLLFLFSAASAFAGAPPTMSIDDPLSSANISSVPYTVTGTCSGGAGTYTSITFDDGSGAVSVDSGTVGAWSHSWNPTDGTYTLNASCTDTASKTGTATAVTGVVVNTCVDGDEATLTVSDPTESATINGLYTVYGQVGVETAPLTMTGVQFRFDGGAWQNSTGDNGSDAFSIVWDTTLETDGAHTIEVQGYDPDCGGTTLISSGVRNVTISNACNDTDLAVVTINPPTEAATVSGVYRIKLDIAGETVPSGLTNVEFSIDGGGYVAATGWDGSNWYYDWDTTGITGPQAATIDARVTDIDCSSVETATQRNVTIDNSGPSNTLADCAGCHNYPPVDSASRDAASGDFIGDHDKHNTFTCATCHDAPVTETSVDFAHRTGNLDLADGSIGIVDNGTYSKGASFAQSNSPTGGTCATVDCHYNNVTPAWGSAGPYSCDICHTAMPPNTDAHLSHYTAKGWTTGDATYCAVCHADNSSGHTTDVTDGSIVMGGGLTIGGTAPDVSCSNTPAGCHNDHTSPLWVTDNGAIVCTDCHTAGGAAAGDPTSGLHTTTNITTHDATITGGAGTACEKCHTAVTTAPHFDGALDTPSAWNTTNIPAGYNNGGDTCAAACHSDAGTWGRRWVYAKTNDVAWLITDDAASAAVCGNCHGSFFTGWNIVGDTSHDNPDVDNDANAGTADNPDTLATSKSSHGECSKCHGWGHANYTAVMHNNVATPELHMNSTLSYDNANPDATCSVNCHSGQALTMKSVSGWTDAGVAGDGVACADCHNGGVNTGSASGAHAAHGATTASVSGDPASVAVCVDCHGEDGTNGGGTHNDGTLDFVTNLTYSAARGVLTGTCSGTAGCHSATSNIAWNQTQAGVNDCAVCHEGTTDVDDVDGTNNSASMIDSADYTAVGHGKTGVVLACMDCHDTAVAHDFSNPVAGSNPFRLAGYGTDVNTFCSNETAGCHVGIPGMLNHSQANAGSNYTWTWTPNCTDCHDPHGDGTSASNIKMVQEYPTDGTSGSDGVGGTTEATAVDFTVQGGVAAGSYADGTAFKGVCQVCHAQTTSFNDGTSEVAGSHPTSGLSPCVSCHSHDSGFKASGCSGCHGGGTSGVTAANYWPDASNANAENDTPGAHVVHMTKLASAVYGLTLTGLLDDANSDTYQKALCEYCHDANAGDHTTALPGEVGPGKTPTGAADDFVYASSSCNTSNCHNNNATPVWTGSSTGCTMCHDSSAGTGIVEPTSGVHAAGPTVSGQGHNEGLGTGCEGCHTAMTGSYPTFENGSTHIDGTNDSATMAHLSLDANLNYNNTNNTCFGAGNTGFTSCHSGVGDDGTWARLWDNTVSYASGSFVECAGCHGGFANDWTYTTGGPDHEADWDTPSSGGDGAEVIGNHSNATNATKCNICHVYSDAPYSMTWGTGDHGDGNITMNSTMGYSNTGFDCSTTCHSEAWGNTDHSMADSGWGNSNIAGPALACTGCHGGGSPSAGVDIDSPHSTTITGYTCEYCHTGHNAGTIQIPNKTFQDATEINYGTGGIDLGNSSGATGATEAEICWNCHTTEARDGEFGQNHEIGGDQVNATGYDYGSLSTMNWSSATWTSGAGFTYKDGSLSTPPGTNHARSSMHDTGRALGSTSETVGDIKCSYCHDVHDTMGPTGKPYLRGNWIANPFPEDGAPMPGQPTLHGGVPRGLGGANPGSTNASGGWQIEQNNPGAYTSGKTYATHSGVCGKCHTEANVLSYWAPHANVVDGFTDSGAANIFDEALRGGQDLIGGPAYMQHQTVTDGDGWLYGLRNVKDAAGISPGIAGDTTPQYAIIAAVAPYDTISYGAASSAADPDIHNFPCSKCHNPHASRLPALLITNCLDVKRNTWDDATGTINAPSAMGQDTYAYMGYTSGQLAYSTTAANCHRYVKSGDPNQQTGAGTENGWNLTSPWE
ncbi:MAG: hypothetical protein C0621_10445 [Desulfuromonas sp.]|nr:MAG: hypothetical protein C0621_10445 [Desulfuromonas sp.]